METLTPAGTTRPGTAAPAVQTGARTAGTNVRRPIIFKTENLGAFPVIDGPAEKIFLEVMNNVTEKNLIPQGADGQSAHYIVTLKAIAIDQYDEAVRRLQGKREVNIEETKGLFMTLNVWKNGDERPALPMRGEKVNVSIGWVDNKDKTQKLLRVIGHSLNPATRPSRLFNLEAIGIASPTAPGVGASTVAPNELVH